MANRQRSVRATDELWDALRAKTAARGETVTDITVRAWEAYLEDDDPAEFVDHWVAYVDDVVVASGEGRPQRINLPPQSVRLEITRTKRP